MNVERKRRHGPLPGNDPRQHCVSVRLNKVELKKLDIQRGTLARGEYLRCAALDKLPPSIPAINQTAWVKLASAAGNLNQIAKHLNGVGDIDIENIREELAVFRLCLISIADNSDVYFDEDL